MRPPHVLTQFLLLIILTMPSCSKKYVGYVTSTHNIPLLDKGMQGQIMGAAGSNHAECQSSFSPLKHVAAMTNLYAGLNGRSAEIGGGIYASTASGFVVECYALRVNAVMKRNTSTEYHFLSEYYDLEIISLDARYDGYSLQFDAGYKMHNNGNSKVTGSFGIGFKYSDVNYDYFAYDRKYYRHYQAPDEFLEEHQHITLPDPSVHFLCISPTARIGIGPAQLMLQYSQHINLNGYQSGYTSFPMYSKRWITLGVEFRIGEGSLLRMNKNQIAGEE